MISALHILGARLRKILSLGCLTTMIIKEVWIYFAKKIASYDSKFC
jgi:hypothetical protein